MQKCLILCLCPFYTKALIGLIISVYLHFQFSLNHSQKKKKKKNKDTTRRNTFSQRQAREIKKTSITTNLPSLAGSYCSTCAHLQRRMSLWVVQNVSPDSGAPLKDHTAAHQQKAPHLILHYAYAKAACHLLCT